MTISTDPRIGTELLGYRIEALLGRGGMGVVYRAYDPRLKRNVALKLIAPELASDERFRERFLAESELAASLEHPNVVPIHDAGEVDGRLAIAMRYVEGTDLKALLREEGALAPARALAVASQVADALDAAHERGLVHRDVKPSNVLLDRRGHAYLADFGLTRRLSEQSLRVGVGHSVGTPDYAAPEQILGGDVDGRADVYSLGCLLYECLTGEPPFRRGSELALLFAHVEEEPPTVTERRPELPAAVDAVLAKALAKAPEKRHASCGELAAAARESLGLDALRARRERKLVALAGLAVALLAAGLAAFFLTRGNVPAPVTAGGELVQIDPATNGVRETIAISDPPNAVSAGNDGVWLAALKGSSVWRIDPRTLAATKVSSVGDPRDVSVFGGTAYVVGEGPKLFGGNVTAYDAGNGRRLGGVEPPSCGTSIAAGGSGVWAAVCPDVFHVSLSGPLKIIAKVPIPFRSPLDAAHQRGLVSDVALAEGAVWALGDAADRRLWRIDPRTGRIVATIELPFPPARLAAGEGALWVTDPLDDSVVRIDPATGRTVATIPIGRGASGIAVGDGSVWASSFVDGTVSRIDPRSNRVVATIDVAGSPREVAFGAGSVWAAGDGG